MSLTALWPFLALAASGGAGPPEPRRRIEPGPTLDPPRRYGRPYTPPRLPAQESVACPRSDCRAAVGERCRAGTLGKRAYHAARLALAESIPPAKGTGDTNG